MTQLSDGQHLATGPSTSKLPPELTSYVLASFVAQLKKAIQFSNGACSDPYLTPSSAAELLALRLVSKSWEPLIIPLYLASTRISDSIQAQTVINIMKRNRLLSAPWLIKRITVDQLVYRESSESASASELDDEEKTSRSLSISNDQATELIDVLGQNITELDLRLYGLFGFSSALVEAIGRLKDLKSLKIAHSFRLPDNKKFNRSYLDVFKQATTRLKILEEAKNGIEDTEVESLEDREANELAALLDAAPNLERLEIGYDEMKPMKFKSKTLSKLRYFCFMYSESDVEAITCIFEKAKDTLKVIEYFSAEEDCSELGPALEVIKNTIEGIFVISAVGQIPMDFCGIEFPRLSVLRTEDGTDVFCQGAFPDWPMLRNIRTLVMDINCQDECSSFGETVLPKLKQMVFHAQSPGASLDKSLVKEFESRGVKCHLITELDVDDIMELDLKLNGPIN